MTSEMRDAMPFMKLLDMEVMTNTADEVRVRMAWREELCTTLGVMQAVL